MHKNQQNIVFNQLLDQHEDLILSRIKRFHRGDIINDYFQEVLIKFYHLIPKFFTNNPQVFGDQSEQVFSLNG